MRYKTYEQALQRVERLKEHGIWPGIIIPRWKAQGYRLTYDPPIPVTNMSVHGTWK